VSRGRTYIEMFDNMVVRRILGPKRKEVAGGGEDCIMRKFITFALDETLLG
jgi:hypothetical protein